MVAVIPVLNRVKGFVLTQLDNVCFHELVEQADRPKNWVIVEAIMATKLKGVGTIFLGCTEYNYIEINQIHATRFLLNFLLKHLQRHAARMRGTRLLQYPKSYRLAF